MTSRRDMTAPATPTPTTTAMPNSSQIPVDGSDRTQTSVEPSLFGILRTLDRRATVRTLLTALLVAAVCWYFGADVSHSILIGCAVTTLGLIFLITNDNPVGNTGWQSDRRTDQQGARRDVAQLSQSLRGSYGRVGYGAVTRARQVARQRLVSYQLDLLNPADRPRIEQLIGHRAYAVLVRGERRPPFLRSFIHCLNALDALDPTKRITLRSRSRRWSRNFTPHRPRRERER
jgi:hypothetical protein